VRLIKLIPLFWLVLCGLVPVPSDAEIYKWIDQGGRVQYGDRPPLEKKDSQKIKSNPQYQKSSSSENAPINNWEDRDRAFRQRRVERQMQAEKEAPTNSAQQMCRNARYKLQLLDGKTVYRVNDKGDRVYMDDAERNTIEQQARKDIAMHCSNF
jgi:hypothetical protein